MMTAVCQCLAHGEGMAQASGAAELAHTWWGAPRVQQKPQG